MLYLKRMVNSFININKNYFLKFNLFLNGLIVKEVSYKLYFYFWFVCVKRMNMFKCE